MMISGDLLLERSQDDSLGYVLLFALIIEEKLRDVGDGKKSRFAIQMTVNLMCRWSKRIVGNLN